MKKKYSLLFITELMMAALWLVFGLGFADYKQAGFHYWGGFFFGLISFAFTIAVTLNNQQEETRDIGGVQYAPIYIGFLFLLVSLVTNGIFMLTQKGDSKKLLVGLNLVYIFAFIVAILYFNSYIKKLSNMVDKQVTKQASSVNISMQLSSLLTLAKREEIKAKLLKVKEKVDYSSNLSQEFTWEIEEDFLLQLQKIRRALLDHVEDAELIEMIAQAETIWDDRSARIAAIK